MTPPIIAEAAPGDPVTLLDVIASTTSYIPGLYPVGGVPDMTVLDYPYGVYSAQLTRGEGYTLDSRACLRGVRVTLQAFGRTTESALEFAEKFIAAVAGKRLAAPGIATTPLRVELDPTPPTRDPDDAGVIGVTLTLTATAKEA